MSRTKRPAPGGQGTYSESFSGVFATGDFTADGGEYYVDAVHGFSTFVMEILVDVGGGYVLGQPNRVADDIPAAGTRRIWLGVLPDAIKIKIVGV